MSPSIPRPCIVAWSVFVATVALGCSAPIQHGLDESAANEIMTSLVRGGIGASKSREDDGAFAIVVPKSEALRALELMRALGLPRGPRAGFGELYKQPSLLPTPTEDRARYVEALAGEIGRTLESVDGVVQARVHLVLPEPEPLSVDGKVRVAAQAAILLKTRAGRSMPISEAEVRKLVAGSVPGLDPAAVAVVFTPAPELSAAPGATLVACGPLRMTADSHTTFLVGLAVVCVVLVVLAGLVLLLSRRLAAAQRNGVKERS